MVEKSGNTNDAREENGGEGSGNTDRIGKRAAVGPSHANGLWRRVMVGSPIEAGVHPHTDHQMRTVTVWFVVAYLMVAFLAAGWTLWTLWTAGPDEPSVANAAADSLAITLNWTPPGTSQAIPLSAEARLILLVFLLGGLGGAIASFNSLANYRGEGALTKSWFLHYLVSPWLGAGVAILMYLVLRAGFFPGSSDQLEGSAIPWGIVAIAGLTGLFYDKSLLKLQQVFATVFNPQDQRGGKLGQLAIATTSLPAARVGVPYSAALKAMGGLGGYDWSVTPELPTGLSLDTATGKIQGLPTAASELGQYTFSVKDGNGTVSESRLEFGVTEPDQRAG